MCCLQDNAVCKAHKLAIHQLLIGYCTELCAAGRILEFQRFLDASCPFAEASQRPADYRQEYNRKIWESLSTMCAVRDYDCSI